MATQAILSSLFPVIPPADPAKKYATFVTEAREAYRAKYEPYSKALVEINEKIKEWTERDTQLRANPGKKEELEAELLPKVDQYIHYQGMRDDLVRTIDIFNRAINRCQPPLLDPTTLQVQQDLGADLVKFKEIYDDMFTTQLNHLTENKKKVEELHLAMKNALVELKLSGDYLASLCEEPTYLAIPIILNARFGRASYFSARVDSRKKEMSVKFTLPDQPAVPTLAQEPAPDEKKST